MNDMTSDTSAIQEATAKVGPRSSGEPEAQNSDDALGIVDLRFADPLIAEIVETWRARQDMVRAQQRLTLQAKSICRRFTAGDKKEAEKLYDAIVAGKPHPLADHAGLAIAGLVRAREPLEDQRDAYEKHLTRLAKELPVIGFCDTVKGFGAITLAKVVGEIGDFTAYEKGITGIWKRAGLAVIDGERQRKKSGDAALLHGYSPERRSVFWNVAASLLKSQGKDEQAGPYRQFYDVEKARQMENGLPKAHAHNRAMRHMTKLLLEDLLDYWKHTNDGGRCRSDDQTWSAPARRPQARHAATATALPPADGHLVEAE